jgi:hypothetical protein
MDLYNLHGIELIDNYVTNVDEILNEVYKHPPEAFKSRGEGSKLYKFNTMCGKGASMHTMMYFSFSPRLRELCVKTVDFGRFPKPTEVAINRYPPGSYLGKHKDGTGGYWKFQLIFLSSEKSHFTWYDRDDNPHLVEEVPGRCVEMPLHIAHESTALGLHEKDKYSMVFVWK